MKNAYSLFLRVPLFTFQPPEGPFLLLSGRHRRSSCLTGLREAGSGRRNQWGALGGVGMLLSSPQLLASASLLSNAIPARPTLSHTNKHIHTDTHTHTWRNSGFNQGPPWEREKGPKPLETLRVVGFPKWGYVCMHTHSHTHASSNTHRLVLSLLKIQTDTGNIRTHMDPHACTIHTLNTHTTHRPYSVSVMPPSCSLGLYQEVSYNKPEDAEILLQRGGRRT